MPPQQQQQQQQTTVVVAGVAPAGPSQIQSFHSSMQLNKNLCF
jgi:hypothetical protein